MPLLGSLFLFRRVDISSSLGLRIKETKEVYEGEVTELTPTESENPLSGYGKTVSHVVVGLKTVKGTKQLKLDPSIYEAILKEKIIVGDVIYIEANTGAVKVCCCLTKISKVTSDTKGYYSAWVVLTRTRPPTTLNRKPMCHYQKETCTNGKS